jgi:polysaccharide export outer membrane protein
MLGMAVSLRKYVNVLIKLSAVLFTAITLLLLSGCVSSSGVLPEDQKPPELVNSTVPQYRLGSGDVVRVSVWKNPDLSVTVPVRPDGFISVPLVGDVQAGGKSPAEIAIDTEQKLARFIRTPKVSIIVEELNSAEFQNRVRVVGGVAEPRSISHRDGMTVIDLVLEAGGVTEFANANAAKLYRTVDDQPKVYRIFLKSILEDGILDTNYSLVPGDVVSIPERRF